MRDNNSRPANASRLLAEFFPTAVALGREAWALCKNPMPVRKSCCLPVEEDEEDEEEPGRLSAGRRFRVVAYDLLGVQHSVQGVACFGCQGAEEHSSPGVEHLEPEYDIMLGLGSKGGIEDPLQLSVVSRVRVGKVLQSQSP
ncbi:hypothetical protein S7711_10330 [Stachybotrys chartarum IBT 7711]|uniref:Uncharacterized protein n=1 Tax=Stachybotrys chartarum (strain CBS 109288 / IBT 7711) TaxID=1280523 RepID=A0A084B370_STACB|nr:hypothetical protein S7711_10330 [Stachybotrys chartarum IBT 7711]KFA45972.1 hypothetical protein S40293_11168 [Stachybotrys chartarum IBT 40293]KFA73836.1 hypothetical protein S40288_11315 [Stachybotrys chartarum IBT 40288]